MLNENDNANELDKLATGDVALNLGEENPDVEVLTDPEDLNKRNYIKITPTFYVQIFKEELEEGEEPKVVEEGEELYKILNPETGVAEKRKLTDEEKREIVIKDLKESKIHFRNVTHVGNKTKVKFGTAYKQKRKRRNSLAKASRKVNRKS